MLNSYGVSYDTINERATTSSSFVSGGTRFKTSGIKQYPLIKRGGLGLPAILNNGAKIVARYDIEARTDVNDQTVFLNARFPF